MRRANHRSAQNITISHNHSQTISITHVYSNNHPLLHFNHQRSGQIPIWVLLEPLINFLQLLSRLNPITTQDFLILQIIIKCKIGQEMCKMPMGTCQILICIMLTLYCFSAPTAKPIDYQNVAKQQQQPPKAGEKSPNNNGSSTTASNVIIDERRMVYPRPFCGVGAALKMVERYRSGLVKNELPTKEANTLTNDLPEHPIILTSEVYDTPNNWNTVWKPENIEKIHPEIYVRDLKNAKETKKRVAELRQHAESVSSTGDDELWMARDIPLMHQLSCLSSRKNRNCLGCSNYWKCVSSVQEEIRPWGPNDMLHFEPHHPETFLGCISMNGAYLPLQRDSLACDVFNTLVWSSSSLSILHLVVLLWRPTWSVHLGSYCACWCAKAERRRSLRSTIFR